jgi:hypothetical protein
MCGTRNHVVGVGCGQSARAPKRLCRINLGVRHRDVAIPIIRHPRLRPGIHLEITVVGAGFKPALDSKYFMRADLKSAPTETVAIKSYEKSGTFSSRFFYSMIFNFLINPISEIRP